MKKKKGNSMDIPDEQLESLARVLLPIMQEYLSSEQGQKITPNGRHKNN